MKTITIPIDGGSIRRDFVPRPTYRITQCPLDEDYPGCEVGRTVWKHTDADSYDGDLVLADNSQRVESQMDSLGIRYDRVTDRHWHYYDGDTCRELEIGQADDDAAE